MALFLQHKERSCQWAVWKMDEGIEELLNLLPVSLKTEYEKEIQQFTSEHRRQEWLSVRVLLFTLLEEKKEIGYKSSGKPFLVDGSFYISISHTQGYVAVILSSEVLVGIDIEQYGKRIHKVIDRFIRPDEQVGSYQGDITWGLLLHWSAKEAVFKYMKDPDADLRKLCLSPFILQKEGQFQLREYVTEQKQLFDVGYRINPDFVLTWVAG